MGIFSEHKVKHDKTQKTKRHDKGSKKSPIEGITKPAIHRMVLRAGVKRMSADVYDIARLVITNHLYEVLSKAITYTEHGRRKTVIPDDVVRASKFQGIKLYGFKH